MGRNANGADALMKNSVSALPAKSAELETQFLPCQQNPRSWKLSLCLASKIRGAVNSVSALPAKSAEL